jgi:hypothetical protein
MHPSIPSTTRDQLITIPCVSREDLVSLGPQFSMTSFVFGAQFGTLLGSRVVKARGCTKALTIWRAMGVREGLFES